MQFARRSNTTEYISDGVDHFLKTEALSMVSVNQFKLGTGVVNFYTTEMTTNLLYMSVH